MDQREKALALVEKYKKYNTRVTADANERFIRDCKTWKNMEVDNGYICLKLSTPNATHNEWYMALTTNNVDQYVMEETLANEFGDSDVFEVLRSEDLVCVKYRNVEPLVTKKYYPVTLEPGPSNFHAICDLDKLSPSSLAELKNRINAWSFAHITGTFEIHNIPGGALAKKLIEWCLVHLFDHGYNCELEYGDSEDHWSIIITRVNHPIIGGSVYEWSELNISSSSS